VSHAADKAVRKRDPEGALVWEVKLAQAPTKLYVVPDGTVVYAAGNGRYVKISGAATPTPTVEWDKEMTAANAILAGPDGQPLYVSGNTANRPETVFLVRLADDGTVVWRNNFGSLLTGAVSSDGSRIFQPILHVGIRDIDTATGQSRKLIQLGRN
jgi:hypothetical protein